MKQEAGMLDIRDDRDQKVVVRATFQGDGPVLFGLYVQNILLSIVTLGIYWFWGKVRIRQYLYGQVALEGGTFSYLGQGKELFIGWLKAIGLFLVGGVLFLGLGFVSQI